MSDDRLNGDEDAELRRLHMLRTFGNVANSVHSRYESLRGRDRRKAIRDPEENSIAVPIEKKLWADKPAAPMRPVEVPAPTPPADEAPPKTLPSDVERPKGDSREILAENPKPGRGFGVFRR